MHKIFLIFFVLMFSDFCFSQGDSPALLRGQAQTSNSVGAFIRTPNSQVTRLNSSTALLETGNTNILVNPNFAHSSYLTGWSTTGDTSTKSEETSVVISGTKSAAFVASAQAINLSQSSTLYAAQFADGVQGIAMCRIKSSVALNLCSISAGTVSATNCVAVNPDSKWSLYKVPFILGATSNGVSVASSGNVTGTAYVDDCFVGAVDLKQDIPLGRNQQYSVTTTSVSSLTGGTAYGVTDLFTVGASSITVNKKVNLSVTMSASLATTDLAISISIGGSVSTSCIDRGRGSSTTYYASCTLDAQLSSGDTITFTSTASASNFIWVSATESVQTSLYTATCGANCVDTFSAYVSGGVVSNENVDWINGNCTLSGTGSRRATCTLNSIGITSGMTCVASGLTAVSGVFDAASVNVVSTSSTTLTIDTAQSSDGIGTTKPFGVVCQKQGEDFVATRNIVGSFNEVMTTPGISKPVRYRADVSSDDSVTNETFNFINGNCTDATTGQSTCSFNSNIFASGFVVRCWTQELATTTGNAPVTCSPTANPSTSSTTVLCKQAAASLNYGFTLFCEGQAP